MDTGSFRQLLWFVLPLSLAAVMIAETATSRDRADQELAETYMQEARDLAGEGEREDALQALEEAFAAGYPTPADVLSDSAYAPIRDNPDQRRTLRELLREHTRQSRVTIVSPGEPGEPLLVRGELVDAESGKPVAGGLIYVYQTGEDGRYTRSPAGGGNSNPRIFGYVKTDESGHFEIRTIVPGSYPGTRISRHIHYAVTARGHMRMVSEILFDEIPAPTDSQRQWAERKGYTIVKREIQESGGSEVSVVLNPGPPQS
jgi:hypothetical protein